jgi:predicted alpha-1,2-mannosidase
MITEESTDCSPEAVASAYDHDFEIVKPYYYKVLLEDPDVWAEYSTAAHGALYQFTANQTGQFIVIVRCTGKGLYEVNESSLVSGGDEISGLTQYLAAKVEPQPTGIKYVNAFNEVSDSPVEGLYSGIILAFNLNKNESIVLKTGISYISKKQAIENLDKETSQFSIEEISAKAKAEWNTILGKIKVEGDEEYKTVFYSALYRAFERMVNISENGRYYSIYDDAVHEDEGIDFYVDDWSWDTYRTTHPLRTIITPDRETAMINSYVRMYQQSGWMPSFPLIFGEGGAMIGHHQAAIITDAYNKGIRDFDIDVAYEGLLKNAMEGTRIPWREGPMTRLDEIYLEQGYFPAKKPNEPETEPRVHSFERRQAVAVTLEHAYDDWVLSRLASELGNDEEASALNLRGQNYKNLYNEELGWMAAKAEDGTWIEPFDPKFPDGPGGREFFAESNSWTYSWFVPHDIYGLMDIMGGRDVAMQKLDQLFDEPLGRSKWQYLGHIPDGTGLTGLFPMGNEPSFHVPYIYSFMGVPWKTQKRIRQLMDSWFRNDLMGVCGDEDGGAMSAWYVFSSMGFYPFCPGYPMYVIGSPVFKKTVLDIGEDKTFTIIAENVSKRNKYIQSAKLNGKVLDRSWFMHDELVEGGTLRLVMGPRPNKEWGAASQNLPPDFNN